MLTVAQSLLDKHQAHRINYLGRFFSSSNTNNHDSCFITFVEDKSTRSFIPKNSHDMNLSSQSSKRVTPKISLLKTSAYSFMVQYAKTRIGMIYIAVALKCSHIREATMQKTFLTHTSRSWYALCDSIKLLIKHSPKAPVYLRWGGLIIKINCEEKQLKVT